VGKTYPNEINRILNMPGGDVGRAVRSFAMETAVEASRIATLQYGRHPGDRPRTGKLARSYQVKVVPGTNQFVVSNRMKYSAAMELGARPHPRKRTSVLQFRGRDGRFHRVKIVHHPGSAGRHTLLVAGSIVLTRRLGSYKAG
jgi:hypothetical protein